MQKVVCQFSGLAYHFQKCSAASVSRHETGREIWTKLRQDKTQDMIQMLETRDIARHRQQDMRQPTTLRIRLR